MHEGFIVVGTDAPDVQGFDLSHGHHMLGDETSEKKVMRQM